MIQKAFRVAQVRCENAGLSALSDVTLFAIVISAIGEAVRIFKTKWAARYVRRERISDASLREAIERAERGLIDADLGGGLIKQRVARPGEGRSGGYRMIVVYRTQSRAFFVFGFAKNERENIEDDELQSFRDVAAELLAHSDAALDEAVNTGKLQEIEP